VANVYDLFKVVRPRGELLLGRVVVAGYHPENLSIGTFRLYDSFAQYDEKTDELNRKEITISDGQFIIVQRMNRHNFDQPSTYERILELDREIQAFKEDYHDYGIIVRNLPDKLEELKKAMEVYQEEQKTVNAELVQDYLDSHIRECRNCPGSFGKSIAEDQHYKVMTIRQAKYYAREAVIVALSIYAPPEVRRLQSVWTN